MPTQLTRPTSIPAPPGVLDGVLSGPVDPMTRRLLHTASGGDPSLLRALVQAGLGLGDLVRDGGRWQWRVSPRTHRLADLIGARAERLAEPQLAALRALSEPWAAPYAVVAQAAQARRAAGEGQPVAPLTRRERQVLALLAAGLITAAIARQLRLSPRTVAKYQERMYRKLGTSDRLTTVLRAQRLGLLPAPAAG